MATVNFSVPDEIKKKFNSTFSGGNKSQVIARLMRQAVDEQERLKRRALAVDGLLKLRGKMKSIGSAKIHKIRQLGRPK